MPVMYAIMQYIKEKSTKSLLYYKRLLKITKDKQWFNQNHNGWIIIHCFCLEDPSWDWGSLTILVISNREPKSRDSGEHTR